MGRVQKNVVVRDKVDERELRDQEVLRANKELAAYFKGRRTEREARAALKTIKAFIRDRERLDPGSRRPLPGAQSTAPTKSARKSKAATDVKKVRRRSARRQIPQTTSEGADGTEAATLEAASLPDGTR